MSATTLSAESLSRLVAHAMVRAGLLEPVLDVECLTLTCPDVMDLMRELKAIGAHNVAAGRREDSRLQLDV